MDHGSKSNSPLIDTDDIFYRIRTVGQMVGILVIASGIKSSFNNLDFATVTTGYVIIRVFQTLNRVQAIMHDKPRRSTNIKHVVAMVVLQIGWCLRLFWDARNPVQVFITFPLLAICELLLPWWAESTNPIPFHPHHISERYAGFTIIILGECILAISKAANEAIQNWAFVSKHFDVLLVGFAGLFGVFALWWLYFLIPSGELLHKKPQRSDVTSEPTDLRVLAALSQAIPICVYMTSLWVLETSLNYHTNWKRAIAALVLVPGQLVIATVVAPHVDVGTCAMLLSGLVVLKLFLMLTFHFGDEEVEHVEPEGASAGSEGEEERKTSTSLERPASRRSKDEEGTIGFIE
ncbi:hypothetical protein HK101_010512 [Irineochytrium annulatum]|nr:hypothetical protein HK101_010512 [Irineochytrium annulatum]